MNIFTVLYISEDNEFMPFIPYYTDLEEAQKAVEEDIKNCDDGSGGMSMPNWEKSPKQFSDQLDGTYTITSWVKNQNE